MGTSASISLCRGAASVKVLKRRIRVEPEQPTQDPDTRAVFGVSLQRLRDAGRLQHGVPLVLKNMVEFLEKYGLQQSGVFRVCGSAPRCRTLRVCLDRDECVDLERVDVPTVAALLKLYLRELPSGLIPHTHSTRMQQALMDSKDGTELVEALKETLHHLPDDNYNILSYLLHFLSRVAAHSQWNHMTSENLATVFGPCIFRVPEGPRMLEEQAMCNTLTLHLLEKHTHLIPNTHTSYTAHTHSCNSSHTHTTHTTHSRKSMLSPPHLTDISRLRQEQSYTSERVCDVKMGVAKEISALPPTAADTHPLSKSDRFISKLDTVDIDERRGSEERGTEAEKKEKAGHTESRPEQEPCLMKKDQSCLTRSHMSLAPERRTPDSSHTDGETHSDTSDETHRKTRHQRLENRDTHSQKDMQSNTSCTHSLSGDTQTESQSSYSEPGSTHTHSNNTHTEARMSQSKHVASDYSCTHTQSPDTHTTRLMEEDINSASSHCIRAPPSPSVHCPISNQAQTLSTGQDSASCAPSSQSRVVRKDDANCSHEMSISQLRQRVQKLKRAIGSLEESFQNIHNYKAALNDKMAHREGVKLMTDLSKARKQLKELRSRQCVHTSEKSKAQKLSVCPHKPAVEETVNTLTQRLKEKRLELNLPQRIQDMSHAQLALEKITLQKCLLYYESLHGRPSSKEERSVMKELYDRYHVVKQAFYSSNTQTSTTRGSEECVHVNLVPGEEDANPVFITQMVTQATDSTNDTHLVHRVEVLRQLKQTRMEKRQLRTLLKEYEKNFLIKNGRSAQREDRLVMAEEYDRYNALKDRLRLLKGMLGKKHNLKAARDRIAI
ncbi:protein FAM13A isoform X1 [Pangasianodon hypophthalmus]|uniref:protein FAM13A isoform X1 n=1 Tax=Pangasianodon hypophthalmus TaxID=310915 RepID=UPI0023078E97|nr:protein FAM13A isoform X1 [Pangasianodon hypophthalmus]XP_053093663.1 protein FAM13A isoform X1 [Pangasianodon hypophthalmus]